MGESNMETLPLIVRKNGFDYTQILRGKRSCIYEQRVSKSVAYYEVFLIRIKAARIIGEKKLDAKDNELEEGKTNKDFTHYITGMKIYH